MNQDWFEMKGVRKRKLNTAVWIPLRAVHEIENTGRNGFAAFKEEFLGVGTVAVPVAARDIAKKLGWTDIGISHRHRPYADEGAYVPAEVYHSYVGDFRGIHLVLDQYINSLDGPEWRLNQDLVLALCLKREGDTWVSPKEGYLNVVRLQRREENRPALIDIRAEHLRDYLCARQMGLYVTSYRSRTVVVENAGEIAWAANPVHEDEGESRWEGRVCEIHEGGRWFGATTRVIHMARTDVDPEVEVPVMGSPNAENAESKFWNVEDHGRKLFEIRGELWRTEWIEPAAQSPRVRGDRTPPTVFFITDAEGTRENRETLSGGRWLWFRPEVMMALSHRRGGGLSWYTRDTGSVWCSPDYGVDFGVNRLGLINVYAKDIAMLPDWQQRVWAGHNVGPDGGVSEELLASQVTARPTDTQAPEAYLANGLDLMRETSKQKLGVSILRQHDQIPEILSRTHRFRAVDRPGLFALAKDLARLTADSLDRAVMHSLLGCKGGSDGLVEVAKSAFWRPGLAPKSREVC